MSKGGGGEIDEGRERESAREREGASERARESRRRRRARSKRTRKPTRGGSLPALHVRENAIPIPASDLERSRARHRAVAREEEALAGATEPRRAMTKEQASRSVDRAAVHHQPSRASTAKDGTDSISRPDSPRDTQHASEEEKRRRKGSEERGTAAERSRLGKKSSRRRGRRVQSTLSFSTVPARRRRA